VASARRVEAVAWRAWPLIGWSGCCPTWVFVNGWSPFPGHAAGCWRAGQTWRAGCSLWPFGPSPASSHGVPRSAGRTGSVTVVQRFGSALNLNLNFHILCLDGVYVRGADGLRFVRDRQVTTEEVAALVVELATRAERWLSRSPAMTTRCR
jgi:hypothetical protein